MSPEQAVAKTQIDFRSRTSTRWRPWPTTRSSVVSRSTPMPSARPSSRSPRPCPPRRRRTRPSSCPGSTPGSRSRSRAIRPRAFRRPRRWRTRSASRAARRPRRSTRRCRFTPAAPADLRGGQRHREAHDADSGPSQRGNCGFPRRCTFLRTLVGVVGVGAGAPARRTRSMGSTRRRTRKSRARRSAACRRSPWLSPGSSSSLLRRPAGSLYVTRSHATAGDHGLVGSATGATGQGLQAPSDSSPAPPMVTVSAPPPASAIPSAAPSATASEAAPSASVAPGRSPQASPPRRANPPTQSPTPQPAPPPRPSKPAPKNDYGLDISPRRRGGPRARRGARPQRGARTGTAVRAVRGGPGVGARDGRRCRQEDRRR